MAREIKRLCTPCAGKLQDAGIGCRRMEDAGGSTGTCFGCGKHRLCFTWEVTYKGAGEIPAAGERDESPRRCGASPL